ncbi:unnamed protein product [Linum trigynum]|uniref:Remorin N-terminal domain-containing protein n=1 Tax=Linum trigynum TaxID=586398 RepID=A0AAV2GF81_9ROSI
MPAADPPAAAAAPANEPPKDVAEEKSVIPATPPPEEKPDDSKAIGANLKDKDSESTTTIRNQTPSRQTTRLSISLVPTRRRTSSSLRICSR